MREIALTSLITYILASSCLISKDIIGLNESNMSYYRGLGRISYRINEEIREDP